MSLLYNIEYVQIICNQPEPGDPLGDFWLLGHFLGDFWLLGHFLGDFWQSKIDLVSYSLNTKFVFFELSLLSHICFTLCGSILFHNTQLLALIVIKIWEN